MVESSGIHPLEIKLPKGVDLYVRSKTGTNGDQKTVWILVNFGKDPATMSLPGQMTDVLGTGRVTSVKLEQYGVAVLSKD
jgi:hypothetical protein